jgi:8-hydroxy-5-deazaflavin:NADPH oxidoreductase
MKISILGSGMVGQALAGKLAEIGQDVMVGTRNPGKIADWLAKNPKVKTGSASESAAHGEIIINALTGTSTLDMLKSIGEAHLNGKILIDIANPLDFSKGMPPTLFVSNTDSLGEQVQRALPQVKVVKTLNTLSAHLMVNPRSLADGDHTLFLSGNDDEAKARVTSLLTEWFGWRDILDIGDITSARGTEALLLLWISMSTKLGTSNMQIKIVR